MCGPHSGLLQVLSNIEQPTLRRKAATDKLVEKIVKRDSWPIQPDILSPPLVRLTSRKPLWLDLQPDDIKSRWRHNWKSAQVVNSHLVCDPTIRQPGFEFRPPSATVVSAELFLHGTGTLRCLQKEMATYSHWSLSLWTMSHIVESVRDKSEWRLISAALCGWRRCFVAAVIAHETHTRRRRLTLNRVASWNEQQEWQPVIVLLYYVFFSALHRWRCYRCCDNWLRRLSSIVLNIFNNLIT